VLEWHETDTDGIAGGKLSGTLPKPMTRKRITDDLNDLLAVLPDSIAQAVNALNNPDDLLEIILDLGRLPTARYITGEYALRERGEVFLEEIEHVVRGLRDFDEDNRAGIERTLHRISAIRNRRGEIVGLTCRVGRAVYGTIDILEDLIAGGKNLLLLGRPGVGKTTMLREAARILAEKKRVIVVDTSNEIGGDGDVPHPAVGSARRMQVATPSRQHEVMIEAVENHNPEVIVIDEIGRELEAVAARTIAERGVQLIGTAHGNTLDNLLLNPTLSDLVGGIESVTLSDEEARRRGTQKTVLERRSPPTFDVLVEIQTRDRLAVIPDVAGSVDALLRGYPLPPEIRSRDEEGKIHVEKGAAPAQRPTRDPQGFQRQTNGAQAAEPSSRSRGRSLPPETEPAAAPARPEGREAVRVFAYGVARNRLVQAAKRLHVPVLVVRDAGEAGVLVTLRSYYRKRQQTIVDFEMRGKPIYVLRANTVKQMERFLMDLFEMPMVEPEEETEDTALAGTRAAIDAVLNGERWVELPPATAYIRRLQHEMARAAELISHSYGKEPYRRVRIYREGSY